MSSKIFLLSLLLVALCLFAGQPSCLAHAAEEAAEEVEAMEARDAYDILGVNKRSTDAEIRTAFKEKSLVSRKRPFIPPPPLPSS